MKNRRTNWLASIAFLVLSVAWVGHSAIRSSLPLPAAAAINSINQADLREHEEFLASDELGGRYALSPSNRIAARYLASRLKRYGFRGGAGDGSFFQRFEIASGKVDSSKTFIQAERGRASQKFTLGRDFQFLPGFVGADAQGEVILIPSTQVTRAGVNDRQDLAGKIAVVPIRQSASQSSAFVVFRQVLRELLERKVAGMILLVQGLTSRQQMPRWLQRRSGVRSRPHLKADEGRRASVPVIWAFDPLIEWLLQGSGIDAQQVYESSTPQALGKRVRVRVSKEESQQVAQNVIGILDGRDPALQHEYVMFSAHYDHLASTGKTIYNGADDDGSGTSALLEIAQAMTLDPPRRSVIIMFHTAEELGLLGSKYFVTHPTVPLASLVVDLNVDMIGRTRPPGDTNPADRELAGANTLYLIGSNRLSQELHRLSEETNRDTVNLRLDYRYNREDHPLRLYYRSDHWNYAKNGIPVIFYFTGIHQDYHKPTDDVAKLDFEKMVRITRLIFATGWRIANLDHRLKLDAGSQ